jgi:hypothetical protein
VQLHQAARLAQWNSCYWYTWMNVTVGWWQIYISIICSNLPLSLKSFSMEIKTRKLKENGGKLLNAFKANQHISMCIQYLINYLNYVIFVGNLQTNKTLKLQGFIKTTVMVISDNSEFERYWGGLMKNQDYKPFNINHNC